MKRTIYIFIFIFLTSVLSVFAYYGAFEEVNINTELAGGETVVYKNFRGSYCQSIDAMEAIQAELEADGITGLGGLSIYYDDPKEVEKEELRSAVGRIIAPNDIEKVKKLGKYNLVTLPVGEYMVTESDFKGVASTFLSVLRICPKLKGFSKEEGYNTTGPIVKIYDFKNNIIIHRMQVK